MIIAAVNEHLTESKRLTNDATGDEVKSRLQDLSLEKQTTLYTKQLDVEIAQEASWAQIQQAMNEADARGETTRPRIAWMMAIVVTIFIFGYTVGMVMVIHGSLKADALPSWEQILVILAVPTALLRSYFGLRELGKQNRARVALGALPIGKSSMTESISTWLNNRNTKQ